MFTSCPEVALVAGVNIGSANPSVNFSPGGTIISCTVPRATYSLSLIHIYLHPELIGEQNDETWNRVFIDWLGTDGAAYVSKTSMPIEEFVEAAKGSGTVFSIAHPLVNYVDEINPISIETTMPRVMASLRERGFAGVEAHYGGTSAGIRALMVKLTRDAGMIPTGGSDYHGTDVYKRQDQRREIDHHFRGADGLLRCV